MPLSDSPHPAIPPADDYHIPNLSVQETVDFAMQCQGDFERYARALAKLDKAISLDAAQKKDSARLVAAEEGGAEDGKDPGDALAEGEFDAEFAAAMRWAWAASGPAHGLAPGRLTVVHPALAERWC